MFTQKYDIENKRLPYYLRCVPMGVWWPRYFTLKEYKNHYTSYMRFTQLLYIPIVYAVAGPLIFYFNLLAVIDNDASRANIFWTCVGAYLVIRFILLLPFIWWLVRNIRSK